MNNKGNVDKRDKYAINMHDKHEIEYWSTKFGVTSEELMKVIKEVGPSSIDVKQYIKNR